MQGSIPQTYTIADILKWNDDGELKLNPKFQRGPVWSPQAKSYLIDSILRGYPIPKLLFRTTVDRDTRRTLRDVVDGQQRLRTIIDFSNGKFALGSKAKEFKGTRYEELNDDQKDSFLAYKLTCEQLINASDEDVLEVFLRLNSYAVPVSESELRNARFDNAFSDLVKEVVHEVPHIWALGVVSERDRVRMVDQSVIAELFAFMDRGVTDGAEPDITRYYETVKSRSLEQLPSKSELLHVLSISAIILNEFAQEPIVQRPHFLMLCASLMYKEDLLPKGRLDLSMVPHRSTMLNDIAAAKASIGRLNEALSSEDAVGPFDLFREARATTQRMKSRQTRFEHFCRAIAGEFAGR